MLRGSSDELGSKNRLGLWIDGWAAVAAAADELRLKNGGRLLISRASAKQG